ncbi:hypothetical protein HWV62_27860 [Athelia sp. TMB]|nr:hypothetical protein HWV62_27860 [Athelia sp. TMB]
MLEEIAQTCPSCAAESVVDVGVKEAPEVHYSVLNPTRRLPVEILGEIFVQLQEMLGGRSIAPTQICRHWREVAIGTSRLWNCIKVPYYSGKAAADAEMVTLWQQRSGGQPLTIMLGRKTWYWGPSAAERKNPAFDSALNSQAHRWKDMQLHVNDAIASFLNNIPEDLPMLHTLYMSGRPRDEVTPFANFSNASALRFLTLNGRLSTPMPIFPWAQLTKCSLLREGGYTWQDGYHVLSQADKLQAYKMELDALSAASDVHPLPGICLDHLLSLDVDIVEGANVRHLFDCLTLPALTDLRVIQTFQSHHLEHTVAMIIRSRCTLKRLAIGSRNVALTHGQLLNIFTLTPMLTELKLSFKGSVGLDEFLMDLMTHYPHHPVGPCCLLPQLASIKLHVNSCLSYEELAEFLSMRFDTTPCVPGAMAQLRTVALIPWDDTTAKLRNRGLDLHILGRTRRLELEEYFIPGNEEDDSEDEEDEDDEPGYDNSFDYYEYDSDIGGEW